MKMNQNKGIKKVTITENEEEEKLKTFESKKITIRADFEKYKKEQKLNVSKSSKINEISLKNQLEELLTANTKKKENLERLDDFKHNLERQNQDAKLFSETLNRFDSSKFNDGYLSVGFHPNRTTSTMFGLTENRTAEVLSGKKAELMETLTNIELLLEQEDELSRNVDGRLEELKKNQILYRRKTNEMKQMNHHADKRFSDLQRVEFLAKNKEAATSSDLKELKENLKQLKINESIYKKQKDDDMKKIVDYQVAKENEMLHTLVELEKQREEFQKKKEELKKLQLQYEDMRDRRKTTRIVSKYIETFAALEDRSNNPTGPHPALRFLEHKDSFPTDSMHDSVTSFKDMRLSKFEDPNRKSPVQHSMTDRHFYLDKIQNFFDRNPEGPDALVDRLITQYTDHCFQEKSLKEHYEDLEINKRRQEITLNELRAELEGLKEKNDYIGMGRTGSMIIERNEHESIDSGMLIVQKDQTTLNQAKFDFDNAKDSDFDILRFSKAEAFLMRCYLDSIEMMSRQSKVLSSIYNQSNGGMSEELKEVAKNIHHLIASLKRPKKGKHSQEHPASQHQLDFHRAHTGETGGSEKDKEQESLAVLDLQEVHDIFLNVFEGRTEEASEFIAKIRNDVMISGFVSVEEIRSYLQHEGLVTHALEGIESLREIGIHNLLAKFDSLYKLYIEFARIAEQNVKKGKDYLESKGKKIEMEDVLLETGSEQSGFIKNAVQKKWQTLKNKYEYDPTQDYRKDVKEIEITDQNYLPNQKSISEENDEKDLTIWSTEDLKAKINEIVGGGKSIWRGKPKEDQERLLMKKEMERERERIERMSDEGFLEHQRKKIKDVKKVEVIELSGEQAFKKAQDDQVQRLAQKAPIEELRRMIENSKVLSKIQILENKKSLTDGKRDIKHFTIENYIPPEPTKVMRSTLYSAGSGSTWKLRVSKNGFTPRIKATQSNKQWPQNSDRNTDSDYEDSPKDVSSFKGQSSTKTVSKFKPRDSPTSEFNTEPVQEFEKPHTQGSKRLSTFENYRKKMLTSGELRFKTLTESQTSPENFPKKNKILMKTMIKKFGGSQSQSTKNKASVDLPKLGKLDKKADPQKKKKKKQNFKSNQEQDQLNMFFSLQKDPLLNMVYSPSFFTTNYPVSTMTEELDYKFDPYKYKPPTLLISEKI